MMHALWTRKVVQALILQETGVSAAIRTVGEYLKRWGMTPQKRVYEQRDPEVKKWLKEHKNMIEVFHLPAYSPELNPDEYVNCDLKADVHSGLPAQNKKQLKDKAAKHIKMLQKKTNRIKSYFEHEKISYAA